MEEHRLVERITNLEEESKELLARVEALEARFGSFELQLNRHGRMLLDHERHLSQLARDVGAQFAHINRKLDAILVSVNS